MDNKIPEIQKTLDDISNAIRDIRFSLMKIISTQESKDHAKHFPHISSFVSDMVRISGQCSLIPVTVVYEIYQEWKSRNNITSMLPLRNNFVIEMKRQLEVAGIPFYYLRPKIKGKRAYCFSGIKIIGHCQERPTFLE